MINIKNRTKWILIAAVVLILITLSLLTQVKAQELEMEDPLVGEWKMHVRSTFYHGDSIQWDWTEINRAKWRIVRTEKGLQVVNPDGSAPEFDAFFTPGEKPQSYDYQVDYKVEDGKAGAKAELRNNFIHYAFDEPAGLLQKKYPDNPDARMHWEFFWEKTSNLMEVDELFLGELMDDWSMISQGDSAMEAQQWESAIIIYTRVIEGGFNNAWAYMNRGFALFDQESYQAAISDLTLNYILTGAADALEMLSYALQHYGYPEFAINYLDDFQSQGSFTAGLYKEYSSALLLKKDFELGLEMAELGLRQYPENVGLIYVKGRLLMELKKNKEACDCWKSAAEESMIREVYEENCEEL